MRDALAGGRRVRTDNVIDDFNRQSVPSEVDPAIRSARLVRVFAPLNRDHGRAVISRKDNSPKFLGVQKVAHGVV